MAKKRNGEPVNIQLTEADLIAGLESNERQQSISKRRLQRATHIGYGQTGTVRLRGNAWRLQYRGERQANGRRPQHSIRLGDRCEMSFQQARAAGTLMLERLAPHRVAPGSTCTWAAWCDRFVKIYLPNLRPGSRRTLGSIIRRHVRPAFADLQIHEIRTARIQTWVATMRSRGAAAETIGTRYRALRWLLRRARAEGLAVQVPAPFDIDLPRSDSARSPGSHARAFTTEELQRILAAAPEPWNTLFMLLAFCGLRVGEGLGLRWCDLDLTAGRLRIVQQAADGREVAPKTAASAAERRIPPRLLDHLRTVHEKRAATLKPMTGPEPAVDLTLVFPSPRGGPYDASGVRRHHLAPLLLRLGIRGKSFHAFRHWFGSAGARSGVPMTTLQRAMRHGDVRSTQRYVTVATEEIDQAIERIEQSCYPHTAMHVLSATTHRNGEECDPSP